MDLSNHVAIVTGGKRIGAVVAAELARRGADIALCYNRSRAEAETTGATIKALGRRVFFKHADLTNAADCEAFFGGHLPHVVVGRGTDPAAFVWFLAWVPHALAHGHWPFFTTLVMAPGGANLMNATSIALPASR